MFNGSGVAIVTPFKDGQVDFQAFDKLLDFHLENDTQAIIVLGTTGEASTINHDERVALVKAAVKRVSGKIPVIVGTGSNSTDTAVKYTKEAEELGADGVLVVTPYYNKATQKGLIAHFTAIANATKLPVILYNVPSRTGVNINPETVAEMAKVKNVIAVKEASGNVSQILEIRRQVPEEFKIFSGNDDQVVAIYSVGGSGVISVSANIIPKEMQQMCRAFEDGNVKEALALQVKYKKLIDLLFCEVNPIPVKAAVSLMGYIENQLRLPLTSMEMGNLEKLKKEMELQQIL